MSTQENESGNIRQPNCTTCAKLVRNIASTVFEKQNIMIDTVTEVFTQKRNKPYTIHGVSGSFLLLGLEAPYEGLSICECKLFKTKEEMEIYIDKNDILEREKYVATWINCH